mgnify:CR=1 FL=1
MKKENSDMIIYTTEDGLISEKSFCDFKTYKKYF